jgi:hypothetical protein
MGSSKTPKWHFLAKIGRIFLALFKPRAEKTTFFTRISDSKPQKHEK